MIIILSWTTKKHLKQHLPGHYIQSLRKFKDLNKDLRATRKNRIQGLFKDFSRTSH